jgi:hypothetical protein
VQSAPASLRRTTVRVAVFVLGVVVVLSVAELTSDRFNAFTQDNPLLTTFLTEAILLVGVYLVIDEIIERRDARRWRDVMSLGVRAMSTRAEGPAVVVRRAVDALAAENASPDGSVDYQDAVARRSDELADWLRADDARARSFAQETRRSASRLEDSIIQWGPTLIEDPESAELLNLLPDIVDSARSAADTIAPAAGWLDRVRPTDGTVETAQGWTDGDRQLFKDSLLEILGNADEFQRRVSGSDAGLRRGG